MPDSLPKDKSIPVDTIPITMSAEGLTPVDTTVTTNSKRGSERTLQSSKINSLSMHEMILLTH